ncbi:MAG TPA: PHP domain-containing protein [Bacteroidales bacterium]|nr:PHP domain-containing protein [Bacteroidales bacterium]
MKNILSAFPTPETLVKELRNQEIPSFREANCHVHSPYSYSSFSDIETLVKEAKNENVSVLGINDFFVTDGFREFHDECVKHDVFPMFNMELTGLIREEQQRGMMLNVPGEAGKISVSGKGLDFPFETGWIQKRQLKSFRNDNQRHINRMITRLNELIKKRNPALYISYDLVKNEYARSIVHERHVARALRLMALRRFSEPGEQLSFIEDISGKKSESGLSDAAVLEQEILRNILKNGGAAYVEEDYENMPDLKKLLKIIITSGGIPFYTVHLDDSSGTLTAFEQDPVELGTSLKKLGIQCVEFIPGNNNPSLLSEYVRYFDNTDFVITFGTKHSSPEMKPVAVNGKDSTGPGTRLKEIAWNGACIIAAHQYLRATGRQGYVLPDGKYSVKQKKELTILGKLVIEYFLNRKYEPKRAG